MGHGDRDSNFKNGNICSIYIKNFLTLDEVEIRPKPHLNIICGPNGTGKSTILCAICICLGGKPSITGRGKELNEFIKRGKDSATVQVEIFIEGDEPNVVICRKFNLANKTSWQLQGKDVKKSQIDDKISDLQIEMDNLCQFLPQDRVANFARMNSKELLEATEKAVGDNLLSEEHMQLRASGDRLIMLQGKVKDLENQLTLAVNRNAQLKDAVANHETKVKLEESIRKLQTQRLWFLYDQKRQLHIQKKEICDKKQLKLKTKRQEIQPSQRELNQKQEMVTQLRQLQKIKSDEIRNKQNEAQNCQRLYERHDERIRDALRELAGKRQEDEQRQRQLGDMNKQLNVLQTQLDNIPRLNEQEVATRLQELTQSIQGASQSLSQLQGEHEEALMTKRAAEHKLTACDKELRGLQDVRRQRMALLQKKNKDAYTATLWLQENKDRFSAPVHAPMCTLLNLADPRYAKYVENRISGNDLVSFVCESKEDMNAFKHAMDRQRTRVNIVYASPQPPSAYRPSKPISQLKRFGFQTYMRECLDAPPAVMSYLCRNYDIHRIPIAQTGDYNNVPPEFNNFYIGDRRYSKTRSRYDGEWATSIQHLKEAELLHITVDTQRITQLKQTMEETQQIIRDSDSAVREALGKNTELMQQLETWRNDKRVLVSRKEERKVLEQRILQKKSQVERCRALCINLDAETEKAKTKINIQLFSMVKVTEERGQGIRKWENAIKEHMQAVSKSRIVANEIQHLQETLSSTKQEIRELEVECEVVGREMDGLKMEAQTSLQKLLRGLGVNHYRQISAEIREQFQSSNLEETEKKLSEEEAHRDCLVTASDKEVEEYKMREAEMRRLQCRLEDAQANTDSHSEELQTVKDSWLPRITELMEDISLKFSQFMARVGCVGEVVLSKPDDPNAFNQYGTTIRVCFRDNEKLRELTAQHQSGGERALSTALYLLALQSLRPVPFRCVDEINQGMDPINERQMLNMLMETESDTNASQYFFVTPKLLTDMKYSDCVNILVVYNSQTTLQHSRLTLKRILKAKKAAKKKRQS